ncbi:MAG: ParA family protein [Duncaniella sp.]|uniref:KGGVGR-motif variant AAA ATPase n=1 Tax=Duncaniella sp. TaxID=2518496 RepID=UPI0023C19F62|nr:hypothetical protein [Duncaniella sp.]MDE6091081.1 ParA family protein [Duncaniella sp.]
MIQLLKKCEALKACLDEAMRLAKIQNFRILINYNEYVQIFIIGDYTKDIDGTVAKLKGIYSDVDIEIIDPQDEYSIPDIFQKTLTGEIVFNHGRRRLTSFAHGVSRQSHTPIVTFYSFKGGQGRSTTLAAFATYLAHEHRKKVFIIDFDIEAPGFNNFFGNCGSCQNGLIEYLMDKTTGMVTDKELERYVRQADTLYCGNGMIHVMSAGNLDCSEVIGSRFETHLHHYIEGLARLDVNNNEYAIDLINGLVSDIENQYAPDVILIDSRTGFNDIMGLFTNYLSHIIVGFFRGDAQSVPGLYHFISSVGCRADIETFVVNSILPSPGKLNKTLFKSFKELLEDIKDNEISRLNNHDIESDDISDLFDRITPFPLSRRDELELVGSSEEDSQDFIDLAAGEFPDYNRLFSAILGAIENITVDNNTSYPFKACMNYGVNGLGGSEVKQSVPIQLSDAKTLFSDINNASEQEKNISLIQWKSDILRSANETLRRINLYADDTDIEDNYDRGQFFLRECMRDLFNLDKYLILGSKGTGKSYLYRALQSNRLVSIIEEYALKQDEYIFLDAIKRESHIFHVEHFGYKNDLFKHNFWLLYTWHIIARALHSFAPDFKPNLDLKLTDLKDENKALRYFEKTINDNNAIICVEEEYRRLDKYLLDNESPKRKKILTVLYDQLDEIVKPEKWTEWIPSLMELWRFKRFNRIFGKLFLRRDLFRKMRGLTNVKDIENQAIDIEWKREEVYSFFFKTILNNEVINRFWGVCYIMNPQEQTRISKLKRHYISEENRFKLDNYYLQPLVNAFFGMTVKTKDIRNLGESYYWLYDNLKNADDTISLRPFIDFIKASLKKWEEDSNRDRVIKSSNAILPPEYYTNKSVRSDSVNRHIDDLVKEIGNYPIRVIFDFFKNNISFKYIKLSRIKFEEALTKILTDPSNIEILDGQDIKSLIDLMITNGIVSKSSNSKGDFYKFAHLYKYYLGLRGGIATERKNQPYHRSNKRRPRP